MPLSALGFSMIAAFVVVLSGRRDPTRAPHVTAVAIALLLSFPLLSLLPKFEILPAASSHGATPGSANLLQLLWLVGAVLLSLRVMLATIALERWRSASRFLEQLPLDRRKVEIRTLTTIQSPVAAGVLRPVIFVPGDWKAWNAEDREMVLAHELAHHRRLDPLWRSLGAMACALHWFNPLVWWLVRRHAVQAEFACDAMVIRNGIHARTYASLLCDLASSQSSPLPAVAIAGRSSLSQRVTRLMQPAGASSPHLSAVLIAIIILTAVIMAVLQRAESGLVPIPMMEIQTRLSADPFPANP